MSDGTGGRERLEATIRGTVQGVGFRWFVVRRASEIGVVGWTSNQADGSVRVVAEGQPEHLDELESWLRDGPPGAEVRAYESGRSQATNEFTAFNIRSGSHRGD